MFPLSEPVNQPPRAVHIGNAPHTHLQGGAQRFGNACMNGSRVIGVSRDRPERSHETGWFHSAEGYGSERSRFGSDQKRKWRTWSKVQVARSDLV